MSRTIGFAFAALLALGACMDAQGAYVAGRADNDMLRFSSSNYVLILEEAR